ncbi:MAG: response regulator transcription factor [Myxococcota bacterium]|nr:response regulator transcription factor [Myxococcota bacterium]
MQRVLIVDDERDLVDLLRFHLERSGYSPLLAYSGEEAITIARTHPPLLVLLDVMLPDLPGTEVCRQLRADPATAGAMILMLSARKDEEDRVAGFRAGADDYVTKPFSVTELLLRIEAALRRRGAAPVEAAVELGGIRLEVASHRCFVDGVEVELTALEFRLLHLLVTRAGKVQSRETLLQEVWRIPGDVPTRTLDTHVLRLRDKLGTGRAWLETVRGVGYRMKGPDS